MKCKSCTCDLSPTEKDDILAALAEGLIPLIICEQCKDEMNGEEDYDDDTDDVYSEY